MKNILLIFIFCFSLIEADTLEIEREKELNKLSKILKIDTLSNDCRIATKELIKKTITHNSLFDKFLKYKDGRYNNSYAIAKENLDNTRKFLRIVCTNNDIKLIKKAMKD